MVLHLGASEFDLVFDERSMPKGQPYSVLLQGLETRTLLPFTSATLRKVKAGTDHTCGIPRNSVGPKRDNRSSCIPASLGQFEARLFS